MRSATLLAAGSWALALLVGFFTWVSPDSPLFPSPGPAGIVIGLAVGLWFVGAVMTAFPRSAPRLSMRVHLGALAPLVACGPVLMLAGRGLLPHPALPLLCIVVLGAAGWWWSRRAEGRPTDRLQEITMGLALALTMLLIGPALVLAMLGPQIWMIAVPNYAYMIARYEAVAPLTAYRPAARAGISADAAGRAMYAIALTGTGVRDSLLLDQPGRLDRPWLADSGPFGRRSGDSVMAQALAGLTRDQRAWLEEAGRHPGLALLDTVAYAARLDPWAGLKLPLPERMSGLSLPTPPIMALRDAARLELYRAALAAADRRPAVADSLARLALGFGLRLRDDADQLIVAVVGTAIAREAGATLALLHDAAGAGPRADSLRAASTLPARAPDDGAELARTRPMAVRREMIDAILSHSTPRPVEWDLAMVLGVSGCTNLRELFYGPTERLQAAYDAIPVGPGERAQAAFAVVRRGILRAAEEGEDTPGFLRLTEFILGRPAGGSCLAAVTVM